ncbi:hypothetical protein F5Y13DRAFT_153803 [Hypoxylon sp. FL1857]|nr:hypothetical protein F5Y13DRAFT_153803 [Hypoxylon sp. FL1857]
MSGQREESPPPYSPRAPASGASPPSYSIPLSLCRCKGGSAKLFQLGQRADEPLYTISIGHHSTQMTLHAGPDENGLALAEVVRQSVYLHGCRYDTIKVFSRNYQDGYVRTRYTQYGKTSAYVMSKPGNLLTSPRDVLIADGDLGSEEFEIRHSRGAEVQELDSNGSGCKLVRLNTDGPGGGRGGRRSKREPGEASDGKEVVAVWLWSSRYFKFKILGSGAQDLGSEFAIVALMTALDLICLSQPGDIDRRA